MDKISLFSLLFFLLSSPVFAEFAPGTYTTFDRYGTPPLPNEQEKTYLEYLEHTNRGGSIRLAVSENMDLIFPSYFQKGLQKRVMPFFEGYIYESLMAPLPMRPDRQLEALIAKNFEADPLGKSYLINLRDDVRFADGSPVTAEDVVKSFAIKMQEISGPPHKAYYDSMWGEHIEVTAPGKLQVRVRFPDIAEGGQRKAILEFLADVKIVKLNGTTNANIQVPYPYMGTGPYRVVRADRDRCELERRPDYWLSDGTKAFNFDRISLTMYRDRVVQREALKVRDIDMMVESSVPAERALDQDLKKTGLKKNDIPKSPDQVTMNVLAMNMNHENLNDLHFREAMVLAMNLDGPSQTLYDGKITALASPGALSDMSPKGLPSEEVAKLLEGDSESEKAIHSDYEKTGYAAIGQIHDRRTRLRRAADILREDGYQIDAQSHKLMKDGKPVALTLLSNTDDLFEGLYFFFKEDLLVLGIALEVKVVADTSSYVAELRKGSYDLVRSPMEIPRAFRVLDDDVLAQRLHSKFASSAFINNSSNLKSPAIDRNLDLLATLDPETPAYRAAAEALLRMLSAKFPFIMIGERSTSAVYADPRLCFPPNTNSLIEVAYDCGSH